MNIFDLKRIEIGRFTYGELRVFMWLNPDQKLSIGNCVSVAPNVLFMLGGDHPSDTLSTYPFAAELADFKLRGEESTHVELSKGPVTIRDDVWIGTGSTILSGVTIGQGAIVAANSLVTKDVPPYSIVGGNPAKVIKYRFAPEQIERLLKTADFSKLTLEKIETYKHLLHEPLSDKNFDRIAQVFADESMSPGSRL